MARDSKSRMTGEEDVSGEGKEEYSSELKFGYETSGTISNHMRPSKRRRLEATVSLSHLIVAGHEDISLPIIPPPMDIDVLDETKSLEQISLLDEDALFPQFIRSPSQISETAQLYKTLICTKRTPRSDKGCPKLRI